MMQVVEFLELLKRNGNGKYSTDFKEETKHGGCYYFLHSTLFGRRAIQFGNWVFFQFLKK